MRYLLLFLVLIPTALLSQKAEITKTLDAWLKAAADAQFDAYFDSMSTDAIFIGTDATENWNVNEFKAFSKPYFDKGKAWSFTSLERHIFLSNDEKMAWFDELLDTQMGLCRGSGVLRLENGKWKIAHYVLSMTIPNDKVKEAISIKKSLEEKQTLDLRQKK
ncbi:nuclear transport factor 2 family protein [Flavobacterium silvaticum]|uniref:Nuclear transport factor 2 family protein n=1 Tax=Flavobacterium silvaticum TaxID=1852020 RepID=A0A972FLN6_9FLAO|nr:nuclear transport factor 2 family protein [Flavobacterium silvaticum]NMH28291.1 nuclear transport factor 2 family protein [Flavobacterium silvaticum]